MEKAKTIIYKYFLFAIALLIGAVGYNLFLRPTNLVAGGVSGISILTNNLFGIEPALFIFIATFAIACFGLFFLDKENAFASFFVSLVFPFFISITEGVNYIFSIEVADVLLIAVFAGIVNGISNGIIFKQGLNCGGIGTLAQVFSKYFSVSVTKVIFIINLFIVLCGVFVFGFNNLLYASLFLYISKFVADKIMFGISDNKMLQIVSDENKKIVKFLYEELDHDVTIYNVMGTYSNEKKKIVMSLIPTREYYMVREAIKQIDSEAFIVVCDSYEVKGMDITLKSVN